MSHQDEVALAEARFRQAIDLVPYPIMIHDGQGSVEYVNREWTRLTGYSIKEIPTLERWEILAFGAPELSLGGGERQVRTVRDTILTWDLRCAPFGQASDGRTIFIRTATDLTAWRRADRARRENAEKFSVLAEESPLGIVIVRDDAMIYCNGMAESIFRLGARRSLGMTIDEWLGLLPDEAGPGLGPLLRGEESRAGPFRLGGEAGFWIEAFAKSIGAAAGAMRMVTFLDVTDRVQAEERERLQRRRLIQAEKLASLGELVAGVAHEVNNPNHTIGINAGILAEAWVSVESLVDKALEGRDGDLIAGMEWPEARKEIPLLLSGVSAASRDIDAIVKGLKDFARSEERPEREDVALNLVVKAALTLLSNYIKKATRRLVLDLAEDLPPVLSHFQRMEQIVVNLVQNSCQALTDADQAVRITTRYDEEEGFVRLLVSDEGRGMAPEVLERIKDPFFTTKHDTGGVGLGVSISESIVAEYGGRLEYVSEPGLGTTAIVSIRPSPAREERARERRDAAGKELLS